MNDRRGYANSHVQVRERKAEKIRRLLAGRVALRDADVLDLGAGSGLISRYLRPHVRSIVAADRDTGPFAVDDVEIRRTDGIALPFAEARFDIVVYNHVLEHVGDREAQGQAIAEIVRVLRPGGLVYLATPNRWTVMEPHFRLPLLSWFPQALADAYVRRLGRGSWYDCKPFARGELAAAMRKGGLEVEDATADAIDATLDIEHGERPAQRVARALPKRGIAALAAVAPTFVMIGRKP